MFQFKDILSVSLILFSVIDILGNIPIIINLRKRTGTIESGKATLVSGIIMFGFLFLGGRILRLFGLDAASFAIAGAIVMFLIGMEMILGIEIFKPDPESETDATIVPLAFPLIAGAGTMTTLISLRAAYSYPNIIVGIVINLILVYIVLKSSVWLENKIGKAGFNILRKVFGIILLAIAIKLFKAQFTL
ncbi:MarC family protein [Tunicatimonas pelagia]|uniref:MarC family protein n=1 Tax=Tunicatimonas pelagia TaxID=931531 RepID=UPI002666813C|nr:MarC family protein [Tunicatimonas pelagia]WKN43687.1 MarC family protein [Tunicatimonas pelagia]